MAPKDEPSLEELDRQLEDAVNYCISSGMSLTKISDFAEPIITGANKKRWQRTIRRLLKLSLVVVIIAILFGNESCYRWVCIGSKLLQLKLLPYWDWTNLYELNCVISNPYYVKETVTVEDCEWCHLYPNVHRLKNLSQDVMTNDYLLKKLPVIVTDAGESWSAADELSFNGLRQMYLGEEVYRECLDCYVYSSMGSSDMMDVLASISTEYGSFNAHWFNCQFKCMKAFRKFYQRPYFIPLMVGSSDENFVLVGQKKTENDGDSVYLAQSFTAADSIAWLTQIKGQFHVTLNSECGCRSIEEILQEGETLAFTSKTWWLTYQAIGEGEAIALGSSGNWD